jgi:hypothetical protein
MNCSEVVGLGGAQNSQNSTSRNLLVVLDPSNAILERDKSTNFISVSLLLP